MQCRHQILWKRNFLWRQRYLEWKIRSRGLVLARNQGCRNPGWGDGGYIPPITDCIPPIIWLWSTSASPPIIWLWSALECWSSLKFGKKSLSILVKTFFWSSLNLLIWKKLWSRFIPPNVENRQNWSKIANYPPQCSTKIGIPARNCNYILFIKLPWPGDSEGTLRSSSQAATCPPVYHTRQRLHTVRWRWIVIEKCTIDNYVNKPCYCPGRIYIDLGPWHFEIFAIFSCQMQVWTKKSLIWARGPWHCAIC